MSRVLLIGGAGFVGSYLDETLKKQGYETCVFDHKVDPRHDTVDKFWIYKTVDEFQPTHIVHLGTLSQPKLANSNPGYAWENMVEGTRNAVTAANQASKLERFVFVSSSMVYGDFHNDEITEASIPNPKEEYGKNKLAGETIVKDVCNCPSVVVRPSAIYGPGDSKHQVVRTFIDSAFAGLPMTVKGEHTKLDFTYVTDVVKGLNLLLTEPGAENETFNLTKGSANSLIELAHIIQRYIPGSRYVLESNDTQTTKRGTLSIEKIKELGFAPTVSLEEGVMHYIEWIKANK